MAPSKLGKAELQESIKRGMMRLAHRQEITEAVGEEMEREAVRFDRLREDSSKPRAVVAFNLFQTPEDIAARMVTLADIRDGQKILEPSAGLGRIYRAIKQKTTASHITLVENAPQCCAELYRETEGDTGARLIQGDWLEITPAETQGFDRIVMNPPFKMGRDVKHIAHAMKFLKPGGLLVSLCYNGARQNRDLKPIADTWEVLPAGSFRESGTNAEVCLLTIKGGN